MRSAQKSTWMEWLAIITLAIGLTGTSCKREGGIPEGATVASGLSSEGFRAFPTPRTFDGPGTVYRIDENRVRHRVAILPVASGVGGVEFVGNITREKDWNVGSVATFMGARDSVGGGYNAKAKMTIRLGVGHREGSFDRDVDSLLKVTNIDIHERNKYYVIRETIAFDSIHVSTTNRSGAGLNVVAKIRERGISAGANLHSQSEFDLSRVFNTPHRVFYTVDEIQPPSGGLAGGKFIRLNRTDPPTWSGEEEGEL